MRRAATWPLAARAPTRTNCVVHHSKIAMPMSLLESFATEAANSAARPTSASPRKLTSGPNEKLVARGPSCERFRVVDFHPPGNNSCSANFDSGTVQAGQLWNRDEQADAHAKRLFMAVG